MKIIKTVPSDVPGYKWKDVFDNGGACYYNSTAKSIDVLNKACSALWDSLPREKQIAINERCEKKKREDNA